MREAQNILEKNKKPVDKIDFEAWLRERFQGETDPRDFHVTKRFHISFVLVGLIVFIVALIAAAWIFPLGRGAAANQYLDFFKGTIPLLVGLVFGLIGK